MAKTETSDIQKVGELYRGLTGLKKSDRPEDVEGQQARAAEENTFQSDLDAQREKQLRAQQANEAPEQKKPAKKTTARKRTTKKAAAKKTAAKKS